MKLSRIGLIGDVHAEDENLEAALNFLSKAKIKRILCVGDIVDGRGDAERCCRLLESFGVVVVRGNHDRWLLQNQMRDLPDAISLEELGEATKLFLGALPTTQRFQTARGGLLLCHGLGENDMQGVTPDDFGYALECKDELQDLMRCLDVRFVVCGHTHRRMVRRFGHLTIINPGTLFDSHQPCVAIADFKKRRVAFHDIENGIVATAAQTVGISKD